MGRNPPIFAKIAEVSKVDVNTVEGRVKAAACAWTTWPTIILVTMR